MHVTSQLFLPILEVEVIFCNPIPSVLSYLIPPLGHAILSINIYRSRSWGHIVRKHGATSFTTFCFVVPHTLQVWGHLVYNIPWLTPHLLVNVGPPPLQYSLIYMALASQFTSLGAFWKIFFIKYLLFKFFILLNI